MKTLQKRMVRIMLWDSHMHTSFSSDCDIAPEDMIASAIAKGLDGITFTDHMDLDYWVAPDMFQLDLPAYYKKMSKLKEDYKDNISFQIQVGVEIGLQPHLAKRVDEALAPYDFDYVIGSSHIVHKIDPYFPQYYDNRTEDSAYLEYFESILENLETCHNFDSYGHLDYVVRYGPNKDRYYSYNKFSDIIDAILHELIHQDKAMEVNTGAFRCGLLHPNPTEDIIKRYHELGGRLLTLGADAHKTEHVGLCFDQVPELLHACGFHEYTIYKNRKPIFYPI